MTPLRPIHASEASRLARDRRLDRIRTTERRRNRWAAFGDLRIEQHIRCLAARR